MVYNGPMAIALTKNRAGVGVGELSSLRDLLVKEQRRLHDLLTQVELALRPAQTDQVTRVVPELTVATKPARLSPLDQLKVVQAATADLRVDNGNLSADRVAKLYGISLSQLSTWLGRSKQAVGKTPDADSLQEALTYFERVARLRMITKDASEFRKWLRTDQPSLDGVTPMEMLAKGEWQALADFAEDILTGTSG